MKCIKQERRFKVGKRVAKILMVLVGTVVFMFQVTFLGKTDDLDVEDELSTSE
jgi:hypothetical protein